MQIPPSRRAAGAIAALVLLVIAVAAGAARAETASEAFEAAWRIEWVDCDPARALIAYQAIIDNRNPSPALAGQIRFRMGACHESLGNADKAAALYTALLAVADDPPGTHQRCRKRLARLSGGGEPAPSPTVSESVKPSPAAGVNDLAAARARIAELEARVAELESSTHPREGAASAEALVRASQEYLQTAELLVSTQQFDRAYDILARGWRRLRAYTGAATPEIETLRAEYDVRFVLLENELEATGALSVPSDHPFRRTATPDFGRLGIYRLTDLFLPGGGVANDPALQPGDFVALMDALVGQVPYRVVDDVLYVRGGDAIQDDTASLVGALRKSSNRDLIVDVDVRAFACASFARIPALAESSPILDTAGNPVGRVGVLTGDGIGALGVATSDPTSGIAAGPRGFGRAQQLYHARPARFEAKSAVPFAGEQVDEVTRRIRVDVRFVQLGAEGLTVLVDILLARVDEPVAMVQIAGPGNVSRAVQAPSVQTVTVRQRLTLPRLQSKTYAFAALPNVIPPPPPDDQHRRLVITVTLSDKKR